MTDRVQLLIDLGALASEAAQRGDDRAADILRRTVAFMVEADADLRALEQRRRSDKARPRRPSVPQKSAESAESVVPRHLRSSSSSLLESNTESTDYYAEPRTAESVVPLHSTRIDEEIQRLIDLLRGAMGDERFVAADAFIRRRPYRTWKGWLDEMLAMLGPASQYTPVDLERVCKDDAALDRPIGSPRGLRSFMQNARIERLKPEPPAGSSPPTKTTNTERAFRAVEGL